jgi:hypothetical protein
MILDIDDGGMRSSAFFSNRTVPVDISKMIAWRAVVSGIREFAWAGAGRVAGGVWGCDGAAGWGGR